jgi:hypothetical protein
VRHVLEAAQPRHGLDELTAAVAQHRREPQRLVHRRLDLVEAEEVGDLLGVVDDVVERRRKREDVLTVDRRHEGLVQAPDDVVRDPVALLLADQDLARELAVIGEGREHLVEQIGRAEHIAGGLLEQVEVLAIAWD